MRAFLVFAFVSGIAAADVRLPGIFGNRMVFQRNATVRVWGWAAPNEEISVELARHKAKTRADKEGRWSVQLAPMAAAAGRTLVVEGNNRIELTGIGIGEVWICSGQSNMQWPLSRAQGGEKAIAESEDFQLHLFTVPRKVAAKPRDDIEGTWVTASPATTSDFSAVAYFFGKYLREKLNIPVGLIHASWGGTPAEAWTRRGALERDASLKPIVERWDALVAAFPEARRKHLEALEAWQKAAAAARAAGKRGPPRPRGPFGPLSPHRASSLFNGMIAPLTPFMLRGVIWYQGESNAVRAHQYQTLFPIMIRDWRQAWGCTAVQNLTFLYVQLANFRAVVPEPRESDWAELREAQRMALAEPDTAMAVTIDIGEARDIHPRNKQEVGRRLALAARSMLYDEREEKTVGSGPVHGTGETRDGKTRIRFLHTAGGLRTRGGDPLRGFAIAGKDKRFRWAHARIEGDSVVVWHPNIPEPVAVRYAWADNPICNLENGAGLPASPFRTDNWPGLTFGKR